MVMLRQIRRLQNCRHLLQKLVTMTPASTSYATLVQEAARLWNRVEHEMAETLMDSDIREQFASSVFEPQSPAFLVFVIKLLEHLEARYVHATKEFVQKRAEQRKGRLLDDSTNKLAYKIHQEVLHTRCHSFAARRR